MNSAEEGSFAELCAKKLNEQLDELSACKSLSMYVTAIEKLEAYETNNLVKDEILGLKFTESIIGLLNQFRNQMKE